MEAEVKIATKFGNFNFAGYSDKIENKEYIALYRVAVSPKVLGKGLAQEILKRAEQYAIDNDIHSIKMDTNFDNLSMAAILGKLGYLYCGEVCRNGEMRIAFEKRL